MHYVLHCIVSEYFLIGQRNGKIGVVCWHELFKGLGLLHCLTQLHTILLVGQCELVFRVSMAFKCLVQTESDWDKDAVYVC